MASLEELLMNINDVKTLKAKRTARKGSIKRLENYLDTLAGVALPRLPLANMERKMAVLQENILAYDSIQERMSQVCTAEQLEAEEADEIRQHSYNTKLQELYQTLIDACQVWHHGYQIQETISELSHSDDVTGTYACQAYEQVAADLKEYRRNIMKMPPDEELNKLRDELTPAFRALTTKVDKELHSASLPKGSASSHHSAASPVTVRPPPSKLKLELPHFSGDILQWKDFWRVFSSVMDKETTLSDAEKICHLTTAMQSPEAKTVVRRAAGATDSYTEVVEALKERYDRCKTVYLHHIKKIESQGPIAYNHASLRESLGFIQDQYQGLARNKGPSLEQYLAAHVELLMDDTCKSHWGVYSAKINLPPTLDDICGFLKERMYTLPEEASPSATKPIRAVSAATKTTTSKLADTRPTVLHTQERSSSGCVVCGDQNLYVYQCPTFHSYNVPKRTDVMNEHQLCYNCLCPGHNLAACKNKKNCRECGRRHHTMLHRPDRAAVHSASQRSAVAPPLIIPQTALVTATAGHCIQKARAQLDTGASISLITSRLATTLKAKRIPCHTEINGVGGQMTSTHQVEVELSSAFCEEGDHIIVRAHVVNNFTDDYPLQELETIRSLPFLKGKPLADPEFDRSGKVDLLLGIVPCNQCTYDEVVSSPNRKFKAHRTIFGWTIGGEQPTSRCSNGRHTVMRTTAKEDPTYALLKEFWTLEQVPGCSNYFTAEEEQAMDHFKDTVRREPDGRYQVKLPRKVPTPELGQSRGAAQRRFLQNERSLAKKDQLPAFQAAVRDYEERGHSEIVPAADLEKPPNETFYLPMFGVVKESSTSTKLRIVYDASAKSSTGSSLNDTLLPGPTLYPLLTAVILRFRVPLFAMSADISKMFREVSLHPDERDFHRYITRDEQGRLQDQRMTRLTFGVTCSPFLATQVLRQTAEDHREEFPDAAETVLTSFYVDDCLAGEDSEEEAAQLASELCGLLQKGQMTLRKWRSDSSVVLQAIPEELHETDSHQIISAPAECHKALGIHWSTQDNNLHIATPKLNDDDSQTMRQLASDVARTFDIMGWFAPVTITGKIMLQRLWILKLSWPDLLPDDIKEEWLTWRTELPELTNHPLPRCYFVRSKKKISMQLHGFADASQAAYGGVVYLRTTYQDQTVDTAIVMAKSRVAPVKVITIPKLELCGALLLSQLLDFARKELNLPLDQTYAWTDSSTVVRWLNSNTANLKIFVANRVEDIRSRVPATHWKHVPTDSNPADLVSRGTMPKELLDMSLWWEGPPWLTEPEEQWPEREDINPDRPLPETKQTVKMAQPTSEEFGADVSSMNKLVRTTAWILRFIHNARPANKTMRIPSERLEFKELKQARQRLYLVAQTRAYGDEIKALKKGEELPAKNRLSKLRPLLDGDGLLRVGGRLTNTPWAYEVKHPLILPRTAHITLLLLDEIHRLNQHPGPSTMMSILAQGYHIPRVRGAVRKLSRNCITCQRVYAKTSNQLMGNLPSERATPSPPFSITGVDFAGPFLCKRGNPRKPTLIKTYIALFVCYSTKAVHLELVSDLTTDAFLAAFRRFTSRRGCPAKVCSDNGSNFTGADKEMKEIYDLLQTQETQRGLNHISTTQQVEWHFSPPRAPHFGGLWESGVKSMKRILRKVVGTRQLTFEELNTIAIEAEATMNSRPLLPVESLPEDGGVVLTPGHFLIGRPLRAPPCRLDAEPEISSLRRWNHNLIMCAEIWKQWSTEYLQTLQKRTKWDRASRNLKVGDVVMVKDEVLFKHSWPTGMITKTIAGKDGRVRVAEVKIGTKIYTRPIHKMVPLLTEDASSSLPPEDVQATMD